MRLARTCVLAPREFAHDRGFEWSGSLSYTTLVSLIPLAILAFSLLGAFEKLLNLDTKVTDLLLNAGLPSAAAEAGDKVRALVNRARETGAGMGVVGTVLLLFTGLTLFTSLEKAVNQLWKTRERRNPYHRFRAFWFVLTLGPMLFGVSLWATAKLRSAAVAKAAGAFGPVVSAVVWFAPFLVTWAAFLVFYVYLPNTRVRFRSALIGAVVGGSLWEAAKRGFNIYVSHASQIDKIYGPLGILPLFLAWLYITWLIVLLGVEVCYVDQNFKPVMAGFTGQGAEKGAPREYQGLRLLLEIHRAFHEGRPPPDLSALSHRLVVRAESARELLEVLEKAGLVRRDRGGFYLPAIDASRVQVSRVVADLRGSAEKVQRFHKTPSGLRLQELFDRAEEARYTVLGEEKLAQIVAADDEAGAAEEPQEGPEPEEGSGAADEQA